MCGKLPQDVGDVMTEASHCMERDSRSMSACPLPPTGAHSCTIQPAHALQPSFGENRHVRLQHAFEPPCRLRALNHSRCFYVSVLVRR